jgi:hypothetical protein
MNYKFIHKVKDQWMLEEDKEDKENKLNNTHLILKNYL